MLLIALDRRPDGGGNHGPAKLKLMFGWAEGNAVEIGYCHEQRISGGGVPQALGEIVWQGNLRPHVRVPAGCEGSAKNKKRANSAASYFRTESPRIAGVIPRECEAGHILSLASALFMTRHGATPASRTGQMKTRQVANWWFRFVDSGRLLDKFMNLRYNAFVARALDKELRVRRNGDRKRLSRREIFQGWLIGFFPGQETAAGQQHQTPREIADPIDLHHRTQFSRFDSVSTIAGHAYPRVK
jgi:hypothetical protein